MSRSCSRAARRSTHRPGPPARRAPWRSGLARPGPRYASASCRPKARSALSRSTSLPAPAIRDRSTRGTAALLITTRIDAGISSRTCCTIASTTSSRGRSSRTSRSSETSDAEDISSATPRRTRSLSAPRVRGHVCCRNPHGTQPLDQLAPHGLRRAGLPPAREPHDGGVTASAAKASSEVAPYPSRGHDQGDTTRRHPEEPPYQDRPSATGVAVATRPTADRPTARGWSWWVSGSQTGDHSANTGPSASSLGFPCRARASALSWPCAG